MKFISQTFFNVFIFQIFLNFSKIPSLRIFSLNLIFSSSTISTSLSRFDHRAEDESFLKETSLINLQKSQENSYQEYKKDFLESIILEERKIFCEQDLSKT